MEPKVTLTPTVLSGGREGSVPVHDWPTPCRRGRSSYSNTPSTRRSACPGALPNACSSCTHQGAHAHEPSGVLTSSTACGHRHEEVAPWRSATPWCVLFCLFGSIGRRLKILSAVCRWIQKSTSVDHGRSTKAAAAALCLVALPPSWHHEECSQLKRGVNRHVESSSCGKMVICARGRARVGGPAAAVRYRAR